MNSAPVLTRLLMERKDNDVGSRSAWRFTGLSSSLLVLNDYSPILDAHFAGLDFTALAGSSSPGGAGAALVLVAAPSQRPKGAHTRLRGVVAPAAAGSPVVG